MRTERHHGHLRPPSPADGAVQILPSLATTSWDLGVVLDSAVPEAISAV
jgi:hypothetical protein